MKRTGEVTLGIIGIVFSALMSLLGIAFTWLSSSDARGMLEEELAADPNLAASDIPLIMDFFEMGGWVLIAAAVLGFVFGLIAVISITGNKKPKLAGWMFIAAAVLIGLISLGAGFLPAILYLIAGIMCFVRKPQQTDFDNPAL
ncbi:MAG TPA: DUF4064 domain-containing protein [Bacillaceae bacterium]